MTRLVMYAENNMQAPIRMHQGSKEITTALAEIGVLVRRLDVNFPAEDASVSSFQILQTLRHEIGEVKSLFSLTRTDYINWKNDSARGTIFRQKSLSEHVHDEVEARIVVFGTCLYYLHACGRVAVLMCQAGDQVVIPKGIPHWFDMGPEPDCGYIRIFGDRDICETRFTGNNIAEQTPRWETLMPQGIFTAPKLSIVSADSL